MQRIIREEFRHHTVIAIAHRLETILDFDRIAVLNRGVIVECGQPTALLAAPSSFRDLYNMYRSTREGTGDSKEGGTVESST